MKRTVATALVIAGLCAHAAASTLIEPPGPRSKSGIYRDRVAIEELSASRGRDSIVRSWKAAAARFPNLRTCLVSNPARARTLTIDWYKIGSNIEADVCLSRVASRIGTVSGMVGWLRTHGFKVHGTRAASPGHSLPYAARVGTDIDVTWSLKDNGPMTRRGVVAPSLQLLLGYGVGCGIFMSLDAKVVSVNCTTNIL